MCVWKQSTWAQAVWHDLDFSSIKPGSPLIPHYSAFLSVLPPLLDVFALRGLHPCSLFLILSNFSFSSPLVLHSLSLSSVTLPLFPARCDQLGDISPADIPGDRALRRPRSPSSLPLLPPFSFFSPHLAVLSLLLLISSTFLSSANNLTRAPPSTNLTPYSADSDISALLSSVSPLIYPSFFFPLYVPLCPLCTNSILPRSFFFFFSHPSLSRSLQVAIHNDGPVFSPVCQPLTCILATTSPLAQVLHAEQANKMPGEWRTSTLVYPPPSIRSVIPSHIKRRPYSAGVWRGKKKRFLSSLTNKLPRTHTDTNNDSQLQTLFSCYVCMFISSPRLHSNSRTQ